MAPEVLAQEHEYGAKADIWSFGITCIEMARGCAPFARMSPLKVLITTLQEPPPQLEAKEGGRTYSKYMRDVVRQCLQKDPEQRPTAAQLLHHKFFKQQGKDSAYLMKALKVECSGHGAAGPLMPQTSVPKERNQAQVAPRPEQPPEPAAGSVNGATQGLAQQERAGACLGRGVIQGAERKSMESYYGNVADLSGWDFRPASTQQGLPSQQSQPSVQPEVDSVEQVTLRSMLPSGVAFPLKKTGATGGGREGSSNLTLRVDPLLQTKQGPEHQDKQEQQHQRQPSLELQPDVFGQEGVRKGRFQ
ncbi:kinase-like domain-containing protein, partial [Dunaliella salina]